MINDDVVAVVMRGGTHRGRGVAKDPDGDFMLRQLDGEDADDFVERAIEAAQAAGCRQIVIRHTN